MSEFHQLEPAGRHLSYRTQVAMVLPNDAGDIPAYLTQAIFDYMGQHFGEHPRYILAGRKEWQQFLRLDCCYSPVYMLIAEENRWYMAGIEVLEVKVESLLEFVG